MVTFFAVYMVWFIALERWGRPHHVITSRWDAMIPFNELFIVPYFLWFFFVPIVCVWLLVRIPQEFDRTAAFIATGMVLCLLIYTVYPNEQMLRPRFLPRRNMFTDMVEMTYSLDTSTNVCPSIHTLNTLAVQIAISRSAALRGRTAIKCASGILSLSIIAATVFLKQHSILDVFWAAVMALALYIVFYRMDAVEHVKRRLRQRYRAA